MWRSVSASLTTSECGWCGGELPQGGVGRPLKFCSPAHKERARRALARVVRDQCIQCGDFINLEVTLGRPRVLCEREQCEQARRSDLAEWRESFATESFIRLVVQAGLERDPSFGFGLGRDMPLKSANFNAYGAGDIDPFLYPNGWDVDGFVNEFGLRGAEVGQTNASNPTARVGGPAPRVMGPTLGDRGSNREPISF